MHWGPNMIEMFRLLSSITLTIVALPWCVQWMIFNLCVRDVSMDPGERNQDLHEWFWQRGLGPWICWQRFPHRPHCAKIFKSNHYNVWVINYHQIFRSTKPHQVFCISLASLVQSNGERRIGMGECHRWVHIGPKDDIANLLGLKGWTNFRPGPWLIDHLAIKCAGKEKSEWTWVAPNFNLIFSAEAISHVYIYFFHWWIVQPNLIIVERVVASNISVKPQCHALCLGAHARWICNQCFWCLAGRWSSWAKAVAMPSNMGQPEDFIEATLARFGLVAKHACMFTTDSVFLSILDLDMISETNQLYRHIITPQHWLTSACAGFLSWTDCACMFVNTIRNLQPQQLVWAYMHAVKTWIYVFIYYIYYTPRDSAYTTFLGTDLINTSQGSFTLTFYQFRISGEEAFEFLRSSIAAMVTGRENIGLVVKRLAAMKIPKATWNKRSINENISCARCLLTSKSFIVWIIYI